MKKVVWKWFMNYEKEEASLNEMSAKGFAFTNYFFGRYVFEESTPGEYVYRMELLKKSLSHPDSRQYLSFMAETGAECVSSWNHWAYFRKKAETGTFEIYSDADSKIAHYRRISSVFLFMGILEVCFVMALLNIMFYGESIYGPLMGPFLLGFYCIVGSVFLLSWNSFRKKIKKLKREKDVWE